MVGLPCLLLLCTVSLYMLELAMGEPLAEEDAANYQIVAYQPTQGILPMFDQQTREFEFVGKKWVMQQHWGEIGVASVVWEPALFLAGYLAGLGPSSFLSGSRIIELGAGTGLVGMVASSLGASSVVLTDKDTRPAEANLRLNRGNLEGNNISVTTLEWGESVLTFDPPFDVILAADVVYIEGVFSALIQTLADLSSPDSVVLLCCKRRYERYDRFFDLLSASGEFEHEVISSWLGRDDIKLHKLRRINLPMHNYKMEAL